MELARAVYEMTEKFPKTEVFGLRMQLRRAEVSVASNIAEGHGRLTDPQLRNSLGIARGSLYEVQTQFKLAKDLAFISQESVGSLLSLTIDTAKLINGLLGVLEK